MKQSSKNINSTTSFDNTNRLFKIKQRFEAYLKITHKALRKGVPVKNLSRTQFPFFLNNSLKPLHLMVEYTTACNLHCLYCNNHLKKREKGEMSFDTIKYIASESQKNNIDRIIIGGGEPTLHKEFDKFSSILSESCKFLSIVTNGNWSNANILQALVNNYDLIEISVDIGGKEIYERSREGGDYSKLVNNIKSLVQLRNKTRTKSLIGIRLMVRPSQRAKLHNEIIFWKKTVDFVMPQFIFKDEISDYSEDIFISLYKKTDTYPRCSMPFKEMSIRWNGDVPFCSILDNKFPNQFLLGNIKYAPIFDLWNNDMKKKYRLGHRKKNWSLTPLCKSCSNCV